MVLEKRPLVAAVVTQTSLGKLIDKVQAATGPCPADRLSFIAAGRGQGG